MPPSLFKMTLAVPHYHKLIGSEMVFFSFFELMVNDHFFTPSFSELSIETNAISFQDP